MSIKSINLTENVYNYLLDVSLREPEILQQLRKETATHPMVNMQISPEQGQFLAFLIKLLNAKKVIEVGVFTGYSSLCMALALPEDGKLIACDTDKASTATAQHYWQKAGISHKVQLEIAPAQETMDTLLSGNEAGTYDFIFIDAEKDEYQDYYERALMLIKSGGVIAVDNVLWSGHPADPKKQDKNTVAIRKFNEQLYFDDRVTISMLPLADGVTLALKR